MSEQDDSQKSFQEYIGTLMGLTFLASLIIGGYELYYWLRHGTGANLNLSTMITEWLKWDLTKVYYPTDWVGVMKLIRFLIDLDLFILGGGICFILLALSAIVKTND